MASILSHRPREQHPQPETGQEGEEEVGESAHLGGFVAGGVQAGRAVDGWRWP